MVHDKKARKKVRLKNLIIAFLMSFFVFTPLLFSFLPRKVEILYFRNDNCPITKITDEMIEQAIAKFGNKINVRVINAQLYPNEPEDTEEVKQLRERYNVIGLPEIIINGKKYKKQFDKNNLFSEICNNFIVKPGECE